MGNYVKPGVHRILVSKETEKLYALEAQLHAKLKECAEEWLKVTKDKGGFWPRAVPQALFDLLDSMGGGEEAARAYVEYVDQRDALMRKGNAP